MNALEKFNWYRREYGFRAALLRSIGKSLGRLDMLQSPSEQFAVQAAAAPGDGAGGAVAASSIVRARFSGAGALSIFPAPGPRLRLNLVTDSINSGSLFGGVGTSIILAALLAKRSNAVLRVVTRTQPPHQPSVGEVLHCNGIDFAGNVEFSFIDVANPDSQLDVCSGDYFLTTSWWTTASTLGSIAPERIIYLLQEDERMFYPYGDDWVRCSETMSRQDIAIVLNTRLLRDHLVGNGFPHLATEAHFFEPAFPIAGPAQSGATREAAPLGRKRLFFYARPNNLRNLFYRGIEALDEAVRTGVLDPDRWEIVLVGKDVPDLSFDGIRPTIMSTLGWADYLELVRSVDLGFCLMATPHPSYPPLDLAAAGALVVTNRFGIKQDLTTYSPAIMAADLDKASLVEGLTRAVAMLERGDRPLGKSGLSPSWKQSLAHVVEALADHVLR